MADDNRPLKYMRYAMGEIVLVVIGILIALYINNWNEKRKERDNFNLNLVEIEKELITNIRIIRIGINDINRRDARLQHLLQDKVTYDDYKYYEYDYIKPLILFPNSYEISNNSYNKIVQNNQNLESDQEEVLENLFPYYLFALIEDYKKHTELVKKRVEEFRRELLNNQHFYSKILKFESFDEEMIKYFLHDPTFKNHVAGASNATYYLMTIMTILDEAYVNAYRKTFEYLEQKELEHNDSLHFEYKVDDFKHYIGRYVPKKYSTEYTWREDSVIISSKENKLKYDIYHPKDSNHGHWELDILPMSKDNFRMKGFGRMGFINFTYDSEGNVTGFTRSWDGQYTVYERIE